MGSGRERSGSLLRLTWKALSEGLFKGFLTLFMGSCFVTIMERYVIERPKNGVFFDLSVNVYADDWFKFAFQITYLALILYVMDWIVKGALRK